jgi:pilus assembly protein CpaC
MKTRIVDLLVLAALALCASALRAQTAPGVTRITIGAGRTYLLDSATDIQKISIASPEVAESVPVTNRTVMINGKAPGETSAIVWLSDGTRQEYDVMVTFATAKLEAAKAQIEKEFGDSVQLTADSSAVYLTGIVKNLFASQRAQSIAASFGKVVNLLKVEVPAQEQEILIKIRFADVDRSKSTNLGFNLIGLPGGYPVNVTTGTASPSRFSSITSTDHTVTTNFNVSDALQLLMFDPHADLLATIQALEAQNVLQILDEPNLTAMNGHTASFLAGGQFPFPTLQGGGSGVGQVTVDFRDFGIKLKVTPVITPRGTIRLHLAPEVSSLDFADALTVNGGTVPALTTRKVETDVEVQNGQSFAIAGLLDRSTQESLSKIPGLGDIPVLGKLFTTKTISKANSELIVVVTPELVTPIPKDQAAPELQYPRKWLDDKGTATEAPRTPGTDKTGAPAAAPGRLEIPVQEMEKIQADEQKQAQQNGGAFGTDNGSGGTSGSPAAPMVSVPLTVPQGNTGTSQ